MSERFKAAVEDELKAMSDSAFDFCWSHEVPRVVGAPTPLVFSRDWVSPNRPVIFQNAFDHWPCLKKWTPEYLRSTLAEAVITVSVTPNGYADAVTAGKFVTPEERAMKFGDFLDVLENRGDRNGVFYVQKQNSNFMSEFQSLLKDAGSEVPWASEAFGKQPDAVNFWMGDKRAITSMHRDHYENIYLVVSGTKTFTLIPPTDVPWVPYSSYAPAKFSHLPSGDFAIEDVPGGEPVPWVAVDPLNPDFEKYPRFANARVITCRVGAGEALYLPSLWFHHVQQTHGCVALNFWYDMEFDLKYVYYKFVEGLCERIKSESEDRRGDF